MSIQLIYTDIKGYQPDTKEKDKLTRAVPAYFRDNIRSSKNDKLKLQRLASGLLFTYAMKQEGYEPDDIRITEGDQGKPMLVNPAGLYFNISHSEDLVLLAVCDDEVGCDIQKVKSGEKIAERFFTPEENAVLRDAGDGERDKLFTRMWARKESYIKAAGEGMKRDLRSFSVLDDVTPDGYIFIDDDLGDHCAAICFRSKDKARFELSGKGDICLIPFQNLTDVVLSY